MKMKRAGKATQFTSVSIPTQLFKKLEKQIDGTGFPSVSSLVAFVLRMLLTEKKTGKGEYDIESIKKRLRELGYM
ncbi:MAG TPA: hypothetical protein VND15_01700 [Candidatus Acidoferrales bacterium]|nr:hypothetical protein [Candidatus Acidoferrales bacterium]